MPRPTNRPRSTGSPQSERRCSWMRCPHSYRLAIFWALHQVAVVTGGPGVGETTLLDAILPLLAAKGMKILLGAPTGGECRSIEGIINHAAEVVCVGARERSRGRKLRERSQTAKRSSRRLARR